VGVLPEDPHSGSFAFWSNKGDESDMTLTRDFDFSAVSGPVKLEYWTWYDLEGDYDFLYLEASTDGKTWKIIQTPSGTDKNISGNSYGWGYNGLSDGWIKEEVDLSKYAGQKVTLRFEYVTDAAVNGEGLLLDDISIPAIDYSTDFESDDSGWQAQGFTRIENRLPQTYRVSLILTGKRNTTVQSLTLDENQSISVPLELGGDYRDAVLVISGTTRATRQKANYSIEIK
jgi:bacillopeptidase F (M6 metalloprotease family)